MKKIIIILIIVLGVIFTSLLIYYFSLKGKVEQKNTDKTAPLPTTSIPVGDKIKIPSNDGDITVNNFYKESKLIDTSVFLTDQPSYSIIYFSDQKFFLISLNAYTETEALDIQKQAEYDLKQRLGVPTEDICKLSVHVQIPATYNLDLSNKDYGLSFCKAGNSNINSSNGIR